MLAAMSLLITMSAMSFRPRSLKKTGNFLLSAGRGDNLQGFQRNMLRSLITTVEVKKP
jgi:hypothetical protein